MLAKEKPHRPCHPVGLLLILKRVAGEAHPEGCDAPATHAGGKWAGAAGSRGRRPALPGTGCCSSVQQLRADTPPTTARSPPRSCCSSVQQLRGAPLRAGAAALPLQLVALGRLLLLPCGAYYAYNMNYAQNFFAHN